MDELGPELVREALSSSQRRAAPDEELHAITHAVESGAVEQAASRAAALLAEGATEVTVITAHLLGVFLARGPASLEAVLDAMRCALREGWTALRPEARKGKVVDAAFRALLRHCVQRWDFALGARTAPRPTWEELDREGARRALAASSALREAGHEVLTAPRFVEQLSELEVRLRTALERATQRALSAASAPIVPAAVAPISEPAPAPEPEPELEPELEEEGLGLPDGFEEVLAESFRAFPDDEEASFHAPPPGLARRREPAVSTSGEMPRLEISPALSLLLRKLAAFETLLHRGDAPRAAVVAEDVRQALERFDPMEYFPTLLAPHFALLSAHLSDLRPYWEARGTLEWRVLEQHYRVDLDGFVEG
jgi:hypothetical protein